MKPGLWTWIIFGILEKSMLSLFLLKEYVSEHAGFVGINLRKLIENEEVSINENKRALILELGTLVD